MEKIRKILTDTRAYSCLDCGKCTAACPVAVRDTAFTPRRLVETAAWRSAELLRDGQLWSCVTCGRCQEICQSGVEFTGLVRALRAGAYETGHRGKCTHGGALDSLMRIMAAPDLRQNRLGWLNNGRQTSPRSEFVYFTGCLPYFDVIFADLGVRSLSIARGAVKLLNAAGITPAVMPNERCCGHDLLWAGDAEGFSRLAGINFKELKASGAKKIVTACPECYHTLKVLYPQHLEGFDLEVFHVSQVLAERSGKLKFKPLNRRVTYHDPCRLGRLSSIYEEPRALLGGIPGLELVEMPRNRKGSLCCGTQAWVNCGAVNKQIQLELAREAAGTGAGTLLTACPKCQIHLKCALSDKLPAGTPFIETEDIVTLAARALVPEVPNGSK